MTRFGNRAGQDASEALRAALHLAGRGDLAAARSALLRLRRAHPGSVDVLQTLGAVLSELGDHDAALEHLGQCVALDPARASTHFNLAKAMERAGRLPEALAAFEQARHLAPGAAQVHLGLGTVLQKLERDDEALAAYVEAARLAPELGAVYLNTGTLLAKRNRHADALRAFDHALAREPDAVDTAFWKASSQQHLCDWSDYEARKARLIKAAKAEAAPSGFVWLFTTMCDDNALLRARAERRELGKPVLRFERRILRPQPSRIRVGYISADFREHAVSSLAVGMFENHDRDRFEVTGICIGRDDGSAMRRRVVQAFDRFEDLGGQSLDSVLARIRALDLDIAVDLMGYTTHSKPRLFQNRVAPIQVNYLGFPGTTGLEAMDYMIVDPFLCTDSLRRTSAEKLVILPDCYQCNDDRRAVADAVPTRAEEGLPQEGFVFCCFNSVRKITPEVFDVWMRILEAVPGSVLWLAGCDATAMANLRREAQSRGVPGDRLIFARRRDRHEDHLARIRLAGLVLDTFPYGAHTTASDALWAGCPVLTKPGETYASRVCGSLLHAVGLPDLVAQTFAEYQDTAIRLATHPDELSALRNRLAENRSTHPLFDTRGFTRKIEAAYREMARIAIAGGPPAEIDVRTLAPAAAAGG